MKEHLSYRQIHLDFHTSEQIKNVGSKFDKKQFQDMLKLGHISSITLFSKCHHGMTYHPTKTGQMHPGLKFDLLGEQIKACKEIGIKTPVYLSAGFDEYYASQHPGDVLVPKMGNNPFNVGYKRLCFNTQYLDYLCRQIEEVVDNYDCDGIFLDIVAISPCVCSSCQKDMFETGMNPENEDDVYQFAELVQKNYYKKTLQYVRKNNPKLRIFQNAGHIFKGDREFLKYVSHLELESLPTGGWGYDHFPSSAKYSAGLGVDFLGMTGKFHISWGEFGGFKHKNAYRYETAVMLAFGSKCSIGDQLHPSGRMNEDTYRLIGNAYREVEKKEPFCADSKSVAETALLSIESLKTKMSTSPSAFDRMSLADTGALRMLLESKILFDVIDSEMNFSKYKVIIIPDERVVNSQTAAKLQKFIAQGGKLILSYQSGLKPDKDEFYFDIGKYHGLNDLDPTYLQVKNKTLDNDSTGNLIHSPFVISGGSIQIETDGEVYADIINSYFNRNLKHFCSHHHSPENQKSKYPGVIIKGNVCYFAHKIFTAYANSGQLLYRELVFNLLENLTGGLMLKTSLQSAGRISLMHQEKFNRYILHLLYASPIKRGGNACPIWGIKDVEVIEDIVKINNICCKLKLDKKIKRVSQALTSKEIQFTTSGREIEFTVPEIDCHQMILLDY